MSEKIEKKEMERTGSGLAVGWFNMAKIGNFLAGELLGVYARRDSLRAEGVSKFFQVKVEATCEVRVERGDEAKVVEAKPGDVVNVNYGPKTRMWEIFCGEIAEGASYQVECRVVGEKIKVGMGRTIYNLELRHRLIKAPSLVQEGVSYRARAIAGRHELLEVEAAGLDLLRLYQKRAIPKKHRQAILVVFQRLGALERDLAAELADTRERAGLRDDLDDVSCLLSMAEESRNDGRRSLADEAQAKAEATMEIVREKQISLRTKDAAVVGRASAIVRREGQVSLADDLDEAALGLTAGLTSASQGEKI